MIYQWDISAIPSSGTLWYNGYIARTWWAYNGDRIGHESGITLKTDHSDDLSNKHGDTMGI